MIARQTMKCPFCGKEFTNEHQSHNRIYCSTKCKNAANHRKYDAQGKHRKKAAAKVDSYIPKHTLPPEIQRLRCAGSW